MQKIDFQLMLTVLTPVAAFTASLLCVSEYLALENENLMK
jgi:hypothetical protein